VTLESIVMIFHALQEVDMTEITFRRATFKNPLPKIIKGTGAVLTSIVVGMIALGESAGRARAAHHLASMGLYEEARRIVLREDEKHD
jgi:hypothetical protein